MFELNRMTLTLINSHNRDRLYESMVTSRKCVKLNDVLKCHKLEINLEDGIIELVRIKDRLNENNEKILSVEEILNEEMNMNISKFLNCVGFDYFGTREFSLFMEFYISLTKRYEMLKIYRTNWKIFDSVNSITASIDCVFSDTNNKLIIIEWSRSETFKVYSDEHMNYSLKLNCYRHILQTQYDCKVIFMMVVLLNPSNYSFICHDIPHIELTNIWPILTK